MVRGYSSLDSTTLTVVLVILQVTTGLYYNPFYPYVDLSNYWYLYGIHGIIISIAPPWFDDLLVSMFVMLLTIPTSPFLRIRRPSTLLPIVSYGMEPRFVYPSVIQMMTCCRCYSSFVLTSSSFYSHLWGYFSVLGKKSKTQFHLKV